MQIKAIRTSKVDGGLMSEDKAYGLVRFRGEPDDLIVAVPSLELHELGVLALSMAPPEPPASEGSPSSFQALTARGVHVALAHDGGLALEFQLTGGGRIGFHLPRAAAAPLRAALERLDDGPDLPKGPPRLL